MTHDSSFDHIIIGTGQAFGTLAKRLLAKGKRIAVIEEGRVGGTCVNTGCTPTKALVASARAAWMARNAMRWGVTATLEGVDFDAVHIRMDKIRTDSRTSLEEWMGQSDDAELIRGHARFAGPKSVQVGDRTISAPYIHIDTGSRPRHLDLPGLDSVAWLDNSRLLDLAELPDHLIIVGGGPIGIEFAQIFRRFGSDVTVLQNASTIMNKEDEDIIQALEDILEEEGIRIECGVDVSRVASDDAGRVRVEYEQGGDAHTISGSHLLIAAGRVPNSDQLDLETAGIEKDDSGYIRVDERCRTTAKGIFALGDVNGQGAFTHTAVNDAEIVLDALFDGPRTLSTRVLTYALFTDPPLGRVGMTEKQARKSGRKVLISSRPMTEFARAKELGETRGLAKILVDAETDDFLGVSVLGPRGDEVVAPFSVAMTAGISCREFRRTVLIHPTIGEMLPWLLDDLEPID